MSRRFTYGNDHDDSTLDAFGNEYPERPWRPDSERSGLSYSPPPLVGWKVEWMRQGAFRDRIVEHAIEEAEANLRMWKRAAETKEGFAMMNLNLAYERLGDILNWLWEDEI